MGEGEDGHRSLRGTGWSSARLRGRLPHHHRCGGCALSDMDEMFHIEVGDLHHRPNTLLDQNMILSIAAFIIKTFICGLCLDFVPFQGEKYLFLIADMVCSVQPFPGLTTAHLLCAQTHNHQACSPLPAERLSVTLAT